VIEIKRKLQMLYHVQLCWHYYQWIQEDSCWIVQCLSKTGLKQCQMYWHRVNVEKLQLYSWKQRQGKAVIWSALLQEKSPVFSSRSWKGMADVQLSFSALFVWAVIAHVDSQVLQSLVKNIHNCSGFIIQYQYVIEAVLGKVTSPKP